MSKPANFQRRIYDFCLSFPGTIVVLQFGHPFFKWKDKPFAIYSDEAGEKLSIKVEKQVQPLFLKDSRFEKTPYVGKHGWITLTLDADVNQEEIEELIRGSYELVSAKNKKAKKRQR